MNKRELVSHVTTGTPATRADAARVVGVVFSAIAASRKPSFKPAKALRGAVNE